MKNTIYIIILLVVLMCTAAGAHAESVSGDSLIHRAIKQAENKQYAESFSTLNEAKSIAEKDKDYMLLFRVYTNWGINQAVLLNYNEAHDNLFKAYQIAVDHLDKRQEMSIINNIAVLYMLNEKYEKANEFFKRNMQYAIETKDSVLMGGVSCNIALAAFEDNKLEEAEEYLDLAESILHNDRNALMQVSNIRIMLYLKQKSYNKLFRLAESMLDECRENNLTIYNDVLLSMSKAYDELRLYDQAILTSDSIIMDDTNLEFKKEYFELLVNIHRHKRDFETALSYTDSLNEVKDMIKEKTDRLGLESQEVQFELLRKERELAEYHAKNNQQKIILIFSAIVLMLMIWALANQKVKSRQQRKIIELKLEQEHKNHELLQNRLKEKETEALLKQKQFQYEIEQKNRQLMSKAMFMANRNDMINNIIQSLSKDTGIEKNPQLEKKLQELRKQLNEDKEWDNFTTYFEQVNEDFVMRLKERHPNLTANEIRFLSLIYIGLSNKEISSLLNITSEYCKKKRQQVAQKLGLESTPLLYRYLSSICYTDDKRPEDGNIYTQQP